MVISRNAAFVLTACWPDRSANMVPGMAERDRFTIREQWKDWWRVTLPPAGRGLHRVNAGTPGIWYATSMQRWRSRQQASRGGWERVRFGVGRNMFPEY